MHLIVYSFLFTTGGHSLARARSIPDVCPHARLSDGGAAEHSSRPTELFLALDGNPNFLAGRELGISTAAFRRRGLFRSRILLAFRRLRHSSDAAAVCLQPGRPAQAGGLDRALIDEAAHLAAELGLRGADATYAAVASRLGLPLATLDADQRSPAAQPISIHPIE